MKRLLSTMMASVLVLAFVPTAFAGDALTPQASDSDVLSITGTENYGRAQEVLTIVNKERIAMKLPPLALDATLTEGSMQRAAEISLYYSHDHNRPDGTSCFTAFPSGASGAHAENIAAGYGSAQGVMQGWFYEEKALYESGITDPSRVGHYLNIINPSFKSIGIGCWNGMYWEQAFSSATSTNKLTRSDSATKTRSVSITYTDDRDTRHGLSLGTNLSSVKLRPGDTYDMEYGIVNGGWSKAYCAIDASNATWTSSNTNVCAVDASGRVTAKALGSATITATLPSGKSASYTWHVTADIETAQVSDIPTYTYTGDAIEPRPTVTLGGKTLVLGTDYSLRYHYNTDVTTRASVIIQGEGDYAGSSIVKYFTIKAAPITSAVLAQTRYTYDGTAKEPGVTVKGNGKTLVAGTDYYAYRPSGTIDAGTKTVTIIGSGNYTGYMELDYTIAPASITSVELDKHSFVYNGGNQRPTVTVKCGSKVLREDLDYSCTFNRDSWASPGSVGTNTIDVMGRGNYIGTLRTTYEVVAQGTELPDEPGTPVTPTDPVKPGTPTTPTNPSTPDISTDVIGIEMFRLYNPNSGEHFYTASAAERDSIVTVGWVYEGVGWTAPAQGVPVYRLYNAVGGEHHYTTNATERDALVAAGWAWESDGGWYSDEGESVPLYRAYNPNAFANNHHYTADANEHATLLALGWLDEGIGWHGIG